jgi:hypothetical protein
MPWNTNPDIQALRLRYNAALAAHADCSRRLIEALMAGQSPSQPLVEAEAKARATVDDARKDLHAAMAKALGSPVDPELPTLSGE